MARKITMTQTAQAVADAHRTVEAALPGEPPEVRAAALAVVLREYLDIEYVTDMEP